MMIRDHLISQDNLADIVRPKMRAQGWVIQMRLFCLEKLKIDSKLIPWQVLFAALGVQITGDN